MSKPHITHVERIAHDGSEQWHPAGSVTIHPMWAAPEGALDRPQGSGWLCKDAKIADRLERAIMAGVVHYNAEVKRDVNGKSYVSASSRVLGRMMNADLKRLGF